MLVVIKNNDTALHTGPSDYGPWLKDNKVCFLRIEGEVLVEYLLIWN